jgi:DNA-3-methyladenine glycosylase I
MGLSRWTDERRLFEKICLEGFQAGLSWLTILNKREAFPPTRSPTLTRNRWPVSARPTWQAPGGNDAGIVRHRRQDRLDASTMRSRVIELRKEFGSLGAYRLAATSPRPSSAARRSITHGGR